ncbi:MAG: DNRLRE domain-containing protein [Candidatus Glassbacteria bacterium]|nr:DNRLRE domain-containing protein [Candidatus Glassbacteria bacterium]
MLRSLVPMFVLAAVVTAGALHAQEVVDTLYCDADATVSGTTDRELVPDGGRQGYLCVGRFEHNPVNVAHQAYLMFELNGIDPSSISGAELRLWKSRARQDSLRVHSVDQDAWNEYGLYWINKPPDGDLLGSVYVHGGQYNAVDVTGFVQAQSDDAVSFCLKVDIRWNASDVYLGFNSREGGAPPMLVVTHGGPKKGDSTPTPGFPSTSSLEHGVYIDAGGSLTEYGSITEAVAAVQPGQEIVLGPGVYYETFDLTPSATAEAPLKIRGDGNPRPIIDGSLNSTSWKNTDRGLIKVSGNFWTIEHLEVRNAHPWAEAGANSGGFYIYPGNDCTIRDCAVYYNGDGIFCTSTSGNLTLEYNEVAWNSFPGAGYEHGHYVSGWGLTIVRFCYIHHNGGQNFKTRAEDLVFAYNYLQSCGNYQVDMVEGSEFTDQDALLIGNVIVTDNQARTNGQFMVFGQNRRGGSLLLFNNTFVHLYPSGSSFVHLWYPGTASVGSTTFEAWNNVFYIAPGAGEIQLLDADKPTPVKGSNNWISDGVSAVPAAFTATLGGDNPGLVNIEGGDYRPLPGSPLVDAGLPGADQAPEFHYDHPRGQEPRTVAGEAIDIGAYELLSDSEAYDFNRDSKLNILDVVALILSIVRGEAGLSADVNRDGAVTIADSIALIIKLRALS